MSTVNFHRVPYYKSFSHRVRFVNASGAPITGIDVTKIRLYVLYPGESTLAEFTGTGGMPSETERYAREIGQGIYQFDMQAGDAAYQSELVEIVSVDTTPASTALAQTDQYLIHSHTAVRALASYTRSPSRLTLQLWLDRDGRRVVDVTNLKSGEAYVYKANTTLIATLGPVDSDSRGCMVLTWNNPDFDEGEPMILRCRCQYPAGNTWETINGYEWAQLTA